MSERSYGRAGWRARAGWALVVGNGLGCFSGCISDAEIPPCVREHSCGSAGTTTDAGRGGSFPSKGGSGGSGPAMSAGGSVEPTLGGSGAGAGEASEGGAGEGGASEGGAGAGPPTSGGAGMPPEHGEQPCPTCVILPAELVAPCQQRPYRAVLHATGGVAPYTWQIAPAVEGWSVTPDPAQEGAALLEASQPAAGDTTLLVRAIDARGLAVGREYRTRARDACWFAYTAQGAGPQLVLVDGLSETVQPAPLAHNTNVYDFEFSPDGRYLAYRYDAVAQFPRGRHLSLVRLSDLQETKLAFGEDAISAYAWSPDGAVLAVGFSAIGDDFLGGFRMPLPGSEDSPTALAPAAGLVQDNLVWIGNDAVAYHQEGLPDLENPGQFLPNPEHQRTPIYARLGAAGFGASQFAADSYEPPVFLQPAPSGFWIINSLTSFFPMLGSPTDSVLHFDVALVAPSGRYSAALDGEALQLFAANDGVFSPPRATSKPSETCPMPLAWSEQDRVACVADVDNGVGLGSHGEVRFFDLEPASEELTLSTLQGFCHDDVSASTSNSCTAQRQGYGFGVSEATGMPRGFSASGRWFAFTRASGKGAYLYWADLAASPPGLSGSLFLGQTGAPARLAFSPDSRKLGLQVGTRLFVKALSGVSSEMLVSTNLAAVEKCTEELPTAPARHCGNTALDARFEWAPDSKALAYRTDDDAITVVDTSHAADVVKFPLPAPLCGAPLCSGGFQFQPLLQQ